MGGDSHQKTEEDEERTERKDVGENEETEKKSLEKLLCDRVSPEEVVVKSGGDDSSSTSTSDTASTASPLHTFKKGGWGVRHTVVLMSCTGVILISMMRYSLSIAIVSMVAKPSHTHAAPAHAQDGEGNGTVIGGGGGGVCPAPPSQVHEFSSNETESSGFDWDERTQGLLLGAFFYGNILTNVLGGRLAERVGSKPVILLGLFLSSVFTLLSPLAARLSTNVFIGVRLALGIAQGIVMPAVSRFMVVWVPPYKRSKYQTFVFIGSEMGVVGSLSLGGWLCSQSFLGGWPAVFYVCGVAGILWCLAWTLAIHENPERHTRITSEEKKYLMAHCVVRKDKMALPWGQLARCLPFWAITVMHIGNNWGYYTFVTELPAYLSNMQHFSIKSNGMMSALPYLIKCCYSLSFCLLMDRATSRGKLSVLSVRRLSSMLATYIPAVALVGMCFVGCNSVAAVAVVSAAISVTGSSYCGLFCSHQDISPHFSGTLYGITNTAGNIMGFLAPAVIGLITYNNQTVQAWNTVFLVTALLYVVAGTFYITCISDQVQAFDTPAQTNQVEEGLVKKGEEAKGEILKTQSLSPSPDVGGTKYTEKIDRNEKEMEI
ncbi:putative inorganic phosphate cotransporter [Eriocheir sinensis]|uniref:putative inorganic phosphate cotransporter n=1 Tax=Eriocheir sinensis TaxID=95602 RepID=UPI0021C580DA|nr:putative inorganic phosphate cotransporter [Eriocheir sinensis]